MDNAAITQKKKVFRKTSQMVLLPMISSILTSDDLVVIQHDLQDALVQEAGVGPAMEQGLNG